MKKSLRDAIASLLYQIVLFSVKNVHVAKRNDIKHLLIIKTDEIGDYILFRRLLPFFKKSETYKSYKISFLGNNAWKPLFEAYDKVFVDNTYWLDKKKFKSDLKYRYQILSEIRKLGASEVVNCIYSRGILIDDAFVDVASSKKNIGLVADYSNRSKKEENLEQRLYSRLIESGGPNLFDVFRNKTFMDTLLRCPEIENEFSINLDVKIEVEVESPYYVIFSGAGKPDKKWKPEYFAEVIAHIYSKYKLRPILCGSKADCADSDAILQHLESGMVLTNLTGNTSLVETLGYLKRAKFTLSVDTGSVHLAAAVRCPVIGLFSGKHYGRFAPYPKEVFDKFYTIYPDHVDALIADNSPLLSQPDQLPNEAIQKILPGKVIKLVDQLSSDLSI